MRNTTVFVMLSFIALGCSDGRDEPPEPWVKELSNGPHSKLVKSISVDGFGSTVIAGVFDAEFAIDTHSYPSRPANAQNLFVAKVDANADLLWLRIFGTQRSGRITDVGMAADFNGEVVITGSSNVALDFGTAEPASEGAFVTRLSKNGDVLWTRHPGKDATFSAVVVLDPSGNAFLAVDKQGSLFVEKLSPRGEVLFSVLQGLVFGASSRERAPTVTGLALDEEGNLFVSGGIFSYLQWVDKPDFTATSPQFDAFVAKFRGTDGGLMWSRRIGPFAKIVGGVRDHPVTVAGLELDDEGNPVIAGTVVKDKFVFEAFVLLGYREESGSHYRLMSGVRERVAAWTSSRNSRGT